ncbi:MAG: hypothetical protein ACR2QB_05950 [Gammaproteobacteria bacterium]
MKSADDALSDYCELLIRHIASLMLDPHRYFEQKLLGELALADARPARMAFFKRLLVWARPGELLDAAQAAELDELLGKRALPSLSFAQDHPELAANLLIGEADAVSLQRLLADGVLGEADQRVVRAALVTNRS